MTLLESARSNSDRMLRATAAQKACALHHLLGQVEAICEFEEAALTKEKLDNMIRSALRYAEIAYQTEIIP